MPKGLDGEEEATEKDAVRFERRRERERRREKHGKRKAVKTKEWILKKKEVSIPVDGTVDEATLTVVYTVVPPTREGRRP